VKLDQMPQVKVTRPTDDRYSELLTPSKVIFTSRDSTVFEIRRLWKKTQQDFLTIGRWLIAAKQALPHGEFDDMVERDLPFSPSVARQLRTVAEFVEEGSIPRERLPDSYSTIYQIATLPEPLRAQAQEKGLLRPDVTRTELLDLKRRAKVVPPASAPAKSPATLLSKDALVERRRTLVAELLEIRRQLRAMG
jgi:hypothetical protein